MGSHALLTLHSFIVRTREEQIQDLREHEQFFADVDAQVLRNVQSSVLYRISTLIIVWGTIVVLILGGFYLTIPDCCGAFPSPPSSFLLNLSPVTTLLSWNIVLTETSVDSVNMAAKYQAADFTNAENVVASAAHMLVAREQFESSPFEQTAPAMFLTAGTGNPVSYPTPSATTPSGASDSSVGAMTVVEETTAGVGPVSISIPIS